METAQQIIDEIIIADAVNGTDEFNPTSIYNGRVERIGDAPFTCGGVFVIPQKELEEISWEELRKFNRTCKGKSPCP